MTQTFFRHGNQKQKTLFRTTGPGLKQRKNKVFLCKIKMGNPRESLQLRFKTGICFKLKQFGESKGEL
jgi:hypothetical protein